MGLVWWPLTGLATSLRAGGSQQGAARVP
jgi:hypothetical protein